MANSPNYFGGYQAFPLASNFLAARSVLPPPFHPPAYPSSAAPPLLNPDFQVKTEIPFYQVRNSAYHASVVMITGEPYVSLSQWWFNISAAQWCPSKKQIFLPRDVWNALKLHIPSIEQELAKLPQVGAAASLTDKKFGMHKPSIFIKSFFSSLFH